MKQLYLLTPFIVDISDEDEMVLCVLPFTETNGYLQCNQGQYRHKYLHQIVAERMKLILLPGQIIDHSDRNKRNCQRNNLRAATPSQSSMNRNIQVNNTSGSTGVRYRPERGQFEARIKINKRTRHLCYGTYQECVEYYGKIAKLYFGDFYKANTEISHANVS